MHPALYKLISLQFRGVRRQMLRGAGSPGRMLVFAVGGLLFLGWLASVFFTLKQKGHADPNRVRQVMPLALLGICILTALTSAGDKAIAFTPGEVDQLFPGPFSRRELLAYKLIKSTLGALLTGLILSAVMLKYALWWPACFAGVFLALLFVQWFSIVILLGGQALGQIAYSRMRKFILIGLGVLAVMGARTWMGGGTLAAETAVAQFHDSAVGHVLLAPFEAFGNAMTAPRAAEAIKWSAYAILLNAGMLALVLVMDGYYLETATAASERRYAKIQRIRAGSFLSMGVSKTANWQLPNFPWAGGAGPIAWRQATNAGRSSRGLLLLLLIVVVGAAPVLAVGAHNKEIVGMLAGLMVWLTFLCSSMLNFDFRGDVDQMESLKALPLAGSAVVIGEMITPILLMTCFHWLLLGVALINVPWQRPMIAVGMAVALPFNAILFEAENLIFLLFPSRPVAVSPGDFQVMGRKFVFLLAKFIIIALAIILAAIPAGLAWVLTGKSLPVPTLIACMILSAQVVAMVPLIAWAYRRYDPSIHTPT
ncbi:MAG TPA: putative ABC exporter domain-containing protein [Tepidisphaeraceae bacterium]|nr:putative ABC exporter domain-containing protein [Tepidisphaeraceae bacterium]